MVIFYVFSRLSAENAPSKGIGVESPGFHELCKSKERGVVSFKCIQEYLIAPKSGASFVVMKNQYLRVIDWDGKQVADLVAFNMMDREEKLSTAATIDNNASLRIGKGDLIYSDKYNGMLEVVEDTVGIHDLLHPACSLAMYRAQYNLSSSHSSCLENLAMALSDYGILKKEIPVPVNLFMNTLIDSDGRLTVETPRSKKGDYILLRAQMELIIGITACAVEESRCNGYECTPIGVEILLGENESL